MIDRTHALPLTRQAAVLGISRGAIYYAPRPVSDRDLALMRQMGLAAICPQPGTSRRHRAHPVYPVYPYAPSLRGDWIWRHEVEGEHPPDARHVLRVRRDEYRAVLATGERKQHIKCEAPGGPRQRHSFTLPVRRQRAAERIPRRRAWGEDALLARERLKETFLDGTPIARRARNGA